MAIHTFYKNIDLSLGLVKDAGESYIHKNIYLSLGLVTDPGDSRIYKNIDLSLGLVKDAGELHVPANDRKAFAVRHGRYFVSGLGTKCDQRSRCGDHAEFRLIGRRLEICEHERPAAVNVWPGLGHV